MKKFIAGMMTAMLLVAVMGTTVFASPSSDSEAALQKLADNMKDNIASVNASKTGNDQTVEIGYKALGTDEVSVSNNAVTEKYGSDASVLAMADLYVTNNVDISGGVTVTLNVSGILKNDTIRVLHQKSSSQNWEELNIVEVGAGYVKVTMTSFSPVVVVRLPSAATSSTPTYVYYTTPSTSSSTVSGTTGSGTTDSNTTDANTGNTDDAVSGSTPAASTGTTEIGTYGQGYSDGYAAGAASVKNSAATDSITKDSATKDSATKDSTVTDSTKTDSTATGTNAVGTTVIRTVGSTSGSNLSTTSPKTGASLPALPILAVFAFAGILVCGKKAQNR